MSFPRNPDARGLPLRPLTRLVLSLGAVLLLVNACTEEEGTPYSPYTPSPPIVVTPGDGDTDPISLDGGDVVLSDGGTLAAKPTCSGGSCAGACPDGGVICAGSCGFLAAVPYALPGTPRDIASGDLNGDGADDLVTVNGAGTAAVLLNRKTGLFQTPTLLPAGTTPTSVLLADVTGDQKLDVLAANASSLVVFRGKGDGTFPTATHTGVGQFIDDMVIGSFGGSQRVALLGGSSEKLLVLKSNGNGSFATPVSLDVPTSPGAMTVEDFNRDGRPDLVLSHATTCTQASDSCESVGVMLGNSDGTFQAQHFTHVEGTPRGLVAANLDTDVNPDLVVADTAGNRVLVFRGQGDGSFLLTPTAYAAGNRPQQLALADIDRDGVKDLLAVNSGGNQVSLYLGQISGTFSQQVLLTAFPQGEGLQGMTVADFDKDGARDLAVLTGSGIQLLWGTCR